MTNGLRLNVGNCERLESKLAVSAGLLIGAALALASCGGAAGPSTSPAAPGAAAQSSALSASAVTPGSVAAPPASPASVSAPATPSPSSSPAAASAAANKITIVYATDSGETTPAWAGVEQGFYKKYGLDVTASHAQGSLSVDALVSGTVQASFTGGADALTAISAGTPIKLVLVLVKENPYAIVVRPDIQSATDLKGKALAIGKLGDTSDVSAHMALSRLGLDASKDVVERQIGNSPARFAALQSGQVAAAVEDQAFTDTLVKQGNHVLVSLAQEKVPYIANGLAVSAKYAQEQPRIVEGMVHGTYDGVQYVLDPSHRQQVIGIIAKYQRADPNDPQLAKIYDSMVASVAHDPTPEAAGADTILKAMQQMDAARYGKLSPADLIDASFMQRAKVSG